VRDPNRIPKVLKAIQEIWEKHPDWRLTQLIINVVETKRPVGGAAMDLWNVEDDDLLKLIGEMEKMEQS
jgi:uncharacterized protein YihD (DUF1040 family)